MKTILPVLGMFAGAMAQSAYDDPQTKSWREICDNNYFDGVGLKTPWEANYRTGIDMGNVSCAELSADWDVYHRRISSTDVALVKSGASASSGANVYFSLYNRRSGVLRTFIWIAAQQDPTSGAYYSLKLALQNDNGDKNPDHSLLAVEGAGKAHTVMQRMDLTKNTDKLYFTDRHVTERWLIEDTFLSYDMNGSHSSPLYFDYYLMSHIVGDIKLTGQVGNDNTSVVTLGVMETAANVYSSVKAGYAKGSKGYDGSVADMTTFGDKLIGLGANALGNSIKNLAVTAGGISVGAPGAGVIWALSPLIEGFLGWGKGRQMGLGPQAISLNGSVTIKAGVTNPRIPVANANFTIENQKALFARTYNTGSDKNLGLFVMHSAPDVKIFEYLGGTWGQSSGETYYKPSYYISIADPTCGLYINPASGAKLKDIKITPVIHFNEQAAPSPINGSHDFLNPARDISPVPFAAKEHWNKAFVIGDRRAYAYTPIEKPTVSLKISFVFDIGRGEVFEAVNTYTPQSITYTKITSIRTTRDFGTCSQQDPVRSALEQESSIKPIWSETAGPNWYSLWGYTGAVGSSVAVSGKVGDSQNSTIGIAVTGSSASFRWKVSSEPTWDKLQVLLNNVVYAQISGQTDWATQDMSFPYGDYTISFRYIKDGSLQMGEDRGMVDQLIIR